MAKGSSASKAPAPVPPTEMGVTKYIGTTATNLNLQLIICGNILETVTSLQRNVIVLQPVSALVLLKQKADGKSPSALTFHVPLMAIAGHLDRD
jgi:hypothetical protein